MKIRSALVATAVTLGAVASFSAQAANDTGGNELVVAVVDTGIRATHQEFDYQGASSTTDQIVAWWDFSGETTPALLPGPGQTWDPRVADPFDGNGHGTATASAAVGLNKVGAAFKQPSFAPGFKLAVAKVGEADGTVSGDLNAAVRWAVDSVKADVINISIGPIVPFPSSLADIDEAIAYARSKGVLVVVSNGNGYGNVGGPGDPGWASPYSNINSFSIGGSGSTTTPYTITTDPEVAAAYTQRLASKSSNTAYANISGTSFSAPLVAGMAAKLMSIAVANGQNASPAYIETLLKYLARDTATPPTFEGYGILDALSFAAGSGHAAAGTLPGRPNPDPNGLYVETVANGLRDIWSEKADPELNISQLHPTGIDPGNGQGVLGPSAPTGLSECDVYSISTTPGQSISVTVTYGPSTEEADIDIYAFQGSGPAFDQPPVTRSTNGTGTDETFTFTAAGGTYSIVVLGWLIAVDQPYSISISTSSSFAGDDYYVSTHSAGLF
ncbi:MAG TPA: S8 family serine peptidase [Actinomycetota bacterium]|nr:S8 family serine peptidase [Actinomycetota bacterium]